MGDTPPTDILFGTHKSLQPILSIITPNVNTLRPQSGFRPITATGAEYQELLIYNAQYL